MGHPSGDLLGLWKDTDVCLALVLGVEAAAEKNRAVHADPHVHSTSFVLKYSHVIHP